MNVKKKQHVLPRNNVKTETKTGIHQVKEKRKEKRKAWTRQYSCKQIDPPIVSMVMCLVVKVVTKKKKNG